MLLAHLWDILASIAGNGSLTNLCLNATLSVDSGEPTVDVARCLSHVPPAQNFTWQDGLGDTSSPVEDGPTTGQGNSPPPKFSGKMYVQASTGLCITARGSEEADINTIALQKCHSHQGRQVGNNPLQTHCLVVPVSFVACRRRLTRSCLAGSTAVVISV